jgi:hypothetical protein
MKDWLIIALIIALGLGELRLWYERWRADRAERFVNELYDAHNERIARQ